MDHIEAIDMAEADANAADAPTVAAQQCGLDDGELKCVNAHDRCYGGAGGPCPYCERATLAPADNGLVERLLREYADFGQRPRGYINPDGPEAADTITAQAAENERLKALLDKAVWQPMDTAPKDGTPVLLWAPDYREFASVGTWCDRVAAWDADAGMMEEGPALFDDACDGPTHWMPLPAAPTAIQEARQ
ncbi:DUF551 domain-containing protein [Pseudaminobacter arsenicus]|uniref:DUF551 domain-containing protein n=1 Tax=Borborobacter arsenicus TaxID=1851146 RepID=A0A432VA63_9HYPH|nr:DUF551 domain-containing protein [Pseudaminobacter arsenicus]RUM98983.1 DUF551 domain-containing protein [Pseudaminobacter arsenicus]